MKYLQQLAIILSINFIGELMNYYIPLPVPASVYGLIIMFFCLYTRIIKLHQVEDVGRYFLIILPIMFISPSVGIIKSVDALKGQIASLVMIAVLSTITVMTVTGLVAQGYIRLQRHMKKESLHAIKELEQENREDIREENVEVSEP